MRLVCVSEHWVRKYQELCVARDIGYIPWSSRLALFVAHGDDLVAGVMVYDTTGPFLFFEHLVTNPAFLPRTRWMAVDMMAGEMMTMCRHAGKLPQVIVRHRGILQILKRYGLRETGAVSLTCEIKDLETHEYEKPQFAPQHSGRFKDSAPTERAPAGDAEDDPGVYAEVLGGVG